MIENRRVGPAKEVCIYMPCSTDDLVVSADIGNGGVEMASPWLCRPGCRGCVALDTPFMDIGVTIGS